MIDRFFQTREDIFWEMLLLGVYRSMALHRLLRRDIKVTYRIRLWVEWTEIRNDWSYVDNTTTNLLVIGPLMTIPTLPGFVLLVSSSPYLLPLSRSIL